MTSSIPIQQQVNSELTTPQTTVNESTAIYTQQRQRVSRILTVELIRASTPLVIAAVGCVIGLSVLIAKPNADVKTAGFSLAGTAIAGAAGLAQSHNR